MANSKGSPVVIGDEGTNGTGSAAVVVQESACHGAQAQGHSGHDATWGVPAVGFGIELVLGVSLIDSMIWRRGSRDRAPGRGAHQMKPEPPEVAGLTGVAGAVAVAGEADQVGTLGRLSRPPALDRGRVDDPGIVAEQDGVGRPYPDQGSELALGLAQSLVVARLARIVGKEGAQVLSGVAQEASFGAHAERRLDDGHGDQFGIAQLGDDANLGSPKTKGGGVPQRVVDLPVQCGDEGVQIGFPAASRSAFGNADCGRLRRVSRGPQITRDLMESVI